MKIYALVGPSGTGKSYQALGLANERDIPYIIDDGLFIKGNKVIAGTSAKKEPTKIAAIRRALFMDTDHAEKVRMAIEDIKPQAILILGTSVKMVKKIVDQLGLPPIDEVIRIDDVSTEKDIRLARKIRREQGKHVIPVPTFEIRKDFSGYFIDPLKIFRVVGRGKKVEALEKTVVRPTYSYMGRFYIADSAIESIAVYNARNVEGVSKVLKANVISRVDGLIIYIEIVVIYGFKIDETMERIQQRVSQDISKLTGMNVLRVNITTKGIAVQQQ